MTNHELAVMTAATIESDELAAALFDKFDREHDLTPAEWKIRMLEMTELTSIRLELANKCNDLITGNYRKWLENRLKELEEKYE